MAVAAPITGWQTVQVSPKDIAIDRSLNPRLDIDKETIEHYIEVYDQLPPVEAFDTERGRLLVDGWHRFSAAKAKGLHQIEVRVRTGTYREAVEYAATANLRHGKPLTSKERIAVAETLLKLHPDWADRRIAAVAGCSQPTVGTRRRLLESQGLLIKFISRVSTNGAIRTVADAPAPAAAPEPEPAPPDPWAGSVLEGDAFDLLGEVEDGSVDLLFVDPPYGILAGQGQDWDTFATHRDLMRFTRRWIAAVLPKLKPTGRLFVCFSQWHVHWLRPMLDYYASPKRCDLIYSNTLIWHYKNVLTAPNNRGTLKLSHEPVLHYRARQAPDLDFSVYGEEQGDVWEIATPQSNFAEGKDHPAQKPVELMRRIISLACPADGLVLDPFAGSGSTAVAAYALNRSFRIIERKPEYVAFARRRLDEALAAAAPEALDAAGD